MAKAPEAPKFIGSPIKRREDSKLLRGLARYVDDIELPGTLHVAVVRSPFGRASDMILLASGRSGIGPAAGIGARRSAGALKIEGDAAKAEAFMKILFNLFYRATNSRILLASYSSFLSR